MCGGEGLPAVLYAAAFHSFSSLTLFDCERRRRRRKVEKGGQEVPVALCTTLCVSLFILERGKKEGKKRRGTDLCWPVRNYLTTPSLTLDSLCFFFLHPACPLPPPPPNASSHPSLLISTTLLCALSFLLFLSHLPLFCCWGNTIWHG